MKMSNRKQQLTLTLVNTHRFEELVVEGVNIGKVFLDFHSLSVRKGQ